ncbi:MAG TPA: HAMP domain-containing sensor histidine kinase [Thermoanaerobaculia bacterium]
MTRPAGSAFSRRFLIGSIVFALFVVCDIALFGWLIFRSLSEREIKRALTETTAEAEELARQIERGAERQGKDLFTAVAVEREAQTYVDQMLRERDIVRRVEIFDKNGMLVYTARSETRIQAGPGAAPGPSVPPTVGSPEMPRHVEPPQIIERESTFDVSEIPDIKVPIGEYGVLQIGISSGEMGKRVEVLRKDLVRQTTLVAVVTTMLLLSAFLAVWVLLRRSARLEVQAAEAERLAYIGTLASGLAHEIRNPLNSLNLNMQMLEEEMEEAGPLPTGQRLLSITRSELSRLERLVTDFLAYAKPRPLELEEMPAVRPLERLREVLAGEIQKRGARVEIDDRSGGARVRVDTAQMNQLLLNLAKNSFAAAEEAGRAPVLKLSAFRQGTAVCLELEDNGVGMSEEEQEQIFELFYSTRKGGTGLGLAIVERIARAHGGRMHIRSTPGAGTAMTVELPLAAPSDPTPRPILESPVKA